MKFSAVTYKQYRKHRDVLKTYIEAAMKTSDLSVKEIEYSLRSRQRLPVVISDNTGLIGFMTLEVDEDALHVTTLAGRLPAGWLKEMYKFLSWMAKQEGLKRLQCGGRVGWRRRLKEFDIIEQGKFLQLEVT